MGSCNIRIVVKGKVCDEYIDKGNRRCVSIQPGTEYQLQLFNPTGGTLGYLIYANGSYSDALILVPPCECVRIDRVPDTPFKLVYEPQYEVAAERKGFYGNVKVHMFPERRNEEYQNVRLVNEPKWGDEPDAMLCRGRDTVDEYWVCSREASFRPVGSQGLYSPVRKETAFVGKNPSSQKVHIATGYHFYPYGPWDNEYIYLESDVIGG